MTHTLYTYVYVRTDELGFRRATRWATPLSALNPFPTLVFVCIPGRVRRPQSRRRPIDRYRSPPCGWAEPYTNRELTIFSSEPTLGLDMGSQR